MPRRAPGNFLHGAAGRRHREFPGNAEADEGHYRRRNCEGEIKRACRPRNGRKHPHAAAGSFFCSRFILVSFSFQICSRSSRPGFLREKRPGKEYENAEDIDENQPYDGRTRRIADDGDDGAFSREYHFERDEQADPGAAPDGRIFHGHIDLSRVGPLRGKRRACPAGGRHDEASGENENEAPAGVHRH